MQPKAQVIFVQVKDNPSKLMKICEVALIHFERKDPLFFLTSDIKAQEFIDALLWRLPEDGFLPHGTDLGPKREIITLCHEKTKIVGTSSVFNLCPEALLAKGPLKLIYELEDSTTPEKKMSSEHKYHSYRDSGHPIAYF